jgi:hypothetical protein
MPRLGSSYAIQLDVTSKPIAEYHTDEYFGLDLPVAPAVMVADEIVIEGSDVSGRQDRSGHLPSPGAARTHPPRQRAFRTPKKNIRRLTAPKRTKPLSKIVFFYQAPQGGSTGIQRLCCLMPIPFARLKCPLKRFLFRFGGIQRIYMAWRLVEKFGEFRQTN